MAPTATNSLHARPTSDRGAVLRGLGLVTIAMIVLPGQDAVAKYISGSVSPGLITWARFLMQTLFTLPFLLMLQGSAGLFPERLWLNVARGALVALSSLLFFTSIKFMPLADALAIFFIEPFILTVLSAVFEHERVGWQRKLAVTAGFVGVLIVVRPSYDVFGWISLLPAAAGCSFAVYVLLNRRMSAFDTPLTMQFTAGWSALGLLTLLLGFGWLAGIPDIAPTIPDAGATGFLLLMGVLGTSGHLLFVQAARWAPSSLLAPMQYVEIACAALLGYLVFGDFPDLWSWIGILIIVAAGASVFLPEDRALADINRPGS
jgi:drug/metabolite transporter (DMT)-like permease